MEDIQRNSGLSARLVIFKVPEVYHFHFMARELHGVIWKVPWVYLSLKEILLFEPIFIVFMYFLPQDGGIIIAKEDSVHAQPWNAKLPITAI